IQPSCRRCYPGYVRLPGVTSPLPADLYVWPAPRTYTGQELAELHLVSCPPLVELLIAQLLGAGARAAQSGEFTLRGFLAGKLDLTQAEAVLGVIEAGNRDELKQALTQLAGGVAGPLQGLREDLLNLLADVEAALDFTEEDIQFVSQPEVLCRLARGMAQLTLLQKQLDQRAVAERPFRVVLGGRPNAGKSSLFNALAGADALVSPEPGTTRDYLLRRLHLDGITVELVDTAGWQEATGTIEQQAQALGHEQAEQADLLLLCLEAGRSLDEQEWGPLARNTPSRVLVVATKCDLTAPAPEWLATSAVVGTGLAALRGVLRQRAQAHKPSALAPSLSRCRHHVTACLEHLRRAHQTVLFGEPAELLALELRGGLDELGEMVGAVYTDDLLDRIFSRFCIGK
ncbi:MAG: tRNA modification GTPase, partial [Gemmataceae bacterium]|nr:tRNA modification GTPase [Gemmataceae bacterium]